MSRIPITLYRKDAVPLLGGGYAVILGAAYLGAWILHESRAWWVWPTELALAGIFAVGAAAVGLVVKQAIDGNINWT